MIHKPMVCTWIVFYFSILSVFCQTNERDRQSILENYGFEKMSRAGQDTMLYYYEHAFTDLYGLEFILGKQKPIPQIKKIFHDFFALKLIPSDLALVDDLWDRRYDAFKQETTERAVIYCAALQCQQHSFDSLQKVYHDTLMTFRDQVVTNLTDEHISTLAGFYIESMYVLDQKKSQFLDNEREATWDISPCMYNYLEHAFDLMRDIPCANYYNLLGVNMSDLDFIDSLDLQEYFSAYARFEVALTKALIRRGCKAHLAIPFYVEPVDGSTETIYRKRNALFYMLTSALPDNIKTFKDQNAISQLDSVQLPFMTDSKLTDSYLDYSVLHTLNYELFPFEEEPGVVTFMTKGALNDMSGAIPSMVAFKLIRTKEEKQGILNHVNEPRSRLKMKKTESNGSDIYYIVTQEESRDAKNTLIEVAVFIIHSDEMIRLYWMTANDEQYEERIKEFVAAIRF